MIEQFSRKYLNISTPSPSSCTINLKVCRFLGDCDNVTSVSNHFWTSSFCFLVYESIRDQCLLGDLHIEGYHDELGSRKQWNKVILHWLTRPYCLDLFFRSRSCLLAFCATLQIPICTAVGFVRINHLVLLRVSIQRDRSGVFFS